MRIWPSRPAAARNDPGIAPATPGAKSGTDQAAGAAGRREFIPVGRAEHLTPHGRPRLIWGCEPMSLAPTPISECGRTRAEDAAPSGEAAPATSGGRERGPVQRGERGEPARTDCTDKNSPLKCSLIPGRLCSGPRH